MRKRKTPLTRSQMMSRIGGRDTAPEMAFRKALRAAGIGYRTGVRGLPGTPDVVMAGAGLAVFVHGCFWHRHPGCRRATTPKSSTGFWRDKFAANVARDRRSSERLHAMGWRVGVLWECEAHDAHLLSTAVAAVSSMIEEARSDPRSRRMSLPVKSGGKRRIGR